MSVPGGVDSVAQQRVPHDIIATEGGGGSEGVERGRAAVTGCARVGSDGW